MSYSPCSHKELDMAEQHTHTHFLEQSSVRKLTHQLNVLKFSPQIIVVVPSLSYVRLFETPSLSPEV